MKFHQLQITEGKTHLHIKYSAKREFARSTEFAAFEHGRLSIDAAGDLTIVGLSIKLDSSLSYDLSWCHEANEKIDTIKKWQKSWNIKASDIESYYTTFLWSKYEYLKIIDRAYKSLNNKKRTLLISKPYILECLEN